MKVNFSLDIQPVYLCTLEITLACLTQKKEQWKTQQMNRLKPTAKTCSRA